MTAPRPVVVRTSLLFGSVQLVMLWVTKPFTTGFERWVPTPLAHAVVLVIALLFFLVLWAFDARDVRRRTERTGPASEPAPTDFLHDEDRRWLASHGAPNYAPHCGRGLCCMLEGHEGRCRT